MLVITAIRVSGEGLPWEEEEEEQERRTRMDQERRKLEENEDDDEEQPNDEDNEEARKQAELDKAEETYERALDVINFEPNRYRE